MSALTDRKASFKQPPKDKSQSQQVRRNKALEDQKRRRAKRVESERHVDLFAGLSLGDSDEEDEHPQITEDTILREGVGHLAPLLQDQAAASTSTAPLIDQTLPTSFSEKGKKRHSKTKSRQRAGKGKARKISPWADKCMYAELLEMRDVGSHTGGSMTSGILSTDESVDGLPEDLEEGWVAVAPVPKGKRCLAVAHQGSGTVGLVPNTTLRSRVLGRPLMPRFPSLLPSDTILDCILDANWKDNGIVHVLDVLQWKGQDVADCETSFRFWWRDTRLSELPPPQPPNVIAPPPALASSSVPFAPTSQSQFPGYQFPYPINFRPIPYYSSTTYQTLATNIIPAARQTVYIPITIPSQVQGLNDGMDIDTNMSTGTVVSRNTTIVSDGLLLYVAQGLYESGTSPLSCWVPIEGYEDENGNAQPHWVGGKNHGQAGAGEGAMQVENIGGTESIRERPLDLFEKLVQRRAMRSGAVEGMAL